MSKRIYALKAPPTEIISHDVPSDDESTSSDEVDLDEDIEDSDRMDEDDDKYPFLTWQHKVIDGQLPCTDKEIQLVNVTQLIQDNFKVGNSETDTMMTELEGFSESYIDDHDVIKLYKRIRTQFLDLMRFLKTCPTDGWGRRKLFAVMCLIHELIENGGRNSVVLIAYLHDFRIFTISWVFEYVTLFVKHACRGRNLITAIDLDDEQLVPLYNMTELYISLNTLYRYYLHCSDVHENDGLGGELLQHDLLETIHVKLGPTPHIAEYEESRKKYVFETDRPPIDSNVTKKHHGHHPYRIPEQHDEHTERQLRQTEKTKKNLRKREKEQLREHDAKNEKLLNELLESLPLDPHQTASQNVNDLETLLHALDVTFRHRHDKHIPLYRT